jgi:hypothetical protein
MPRSTARFAGALYFVTHVTSVAAAVLYGGSGFDPTAGLASRGSVLLGALLEIVLAVAVVGTAAALYPLIRGYSGGTAAAYLGLRTLEASVILVGVVAVLPIVARPATLAAPALSPEVGSALHLLHDWTFLVGPGLVVPVHTVVLAALLLRRRLVPRYIAVLGLVGGPLVGLMNVGVMFGVTGVLAAAVIPVFAWEITLAVHLIVRGLPEPFAAASQPRPATPERRQVASTASASSNSASSAPSAPSSSRPTGSPSGV